MSTSEHWESVYRDKDASEVSWYAPHLAASLDFITSVAGPEARIVDIGGGASTLVDDLLAKGYRNVTVLDISEQALEVAKARLGERERRVTWRAADITQVDLGVATFDVWHDRAALHFLTAPEAQSAYSSTLLRSLAPGGHALISTFSLSGPTKCSGLDIVRYSADSLSRLFGDGLTLVEATERTHTTPAGREQAFLACHFRRT